MGRNCPLFIGGLHSDVSINQPGDPWIFRVSDEYQDRLSPHSVQVFLTEFSSSLTEGGAVGVGIQDFLVIAPATAIDTGGVRHRRFNFVHV